jgi:hypothetical protein
MLCALGSAVFATAITSVSTGFGRAMSASAFAVGFGLTTWIGSGRAIDASWTGGLVALAAAWHLVYAGGAIVMIAAAGAMAALWALLLQAIGAPGIVAIPSAAFVPVVSAHLSTRRPRFAPLLLREEAMLVVLILGVLVAMAPTVSQGGSPRLP